MLIKEWHDLGELSHIPFQFAAKPTFERFHFLVATGVFRCDEIMRQTGFNGGPKRRDELTLLQMMGGYGLPSKENTLPCQRCIQT